MKKLIIHEKIGKKNERYILCKPIDFVLHQLGTFIRSNQSSYRFVCRVNIDLRPLYTHTLSRPPTAVH